MLTPEQLTQGLEITKTQSSVIFDLIDAKKADGALHLAADILDSKVQTLASGDGSELLSFVEMAAEDVATIMYDYTSKEFSVGSLTAWLENNQDKLSSTPSNDEEEMDDEPYVMFHWTQGAMLATQVDGMRELIAEHGDPERYEIVPAPVDIFED